LVGGFSGLETADVSTRIPTVLLDFFNGKEPTNRESNPDEVVVTVLLFKLLS
jgi:hypothetical protein